MQNYNSCWLVAKSCPTLCHHMDCSLPGSLSMEFPRQKYWSGLPLPSPGDPNPGIKPVSPAEPPQKPRTVTTTTNTSAIYWPANHASSVANYFFLWGKIPKSKHYKTLIKGLELFTPDGEEMGQRIRKGMVTISKYCWRTTKTNRLPIHLH